jgi:hypothetical protein
LSVTDHFKPKTEVDKPIMYSDKVFVSAAIEWLIDGDLVSSSFSSTCHAGADLFGPVTPILAIASLQPAILQEDG